MPEYTVRWTIELSADSPEEAVTEALMIQRDPTSEATCFIVEGGDLEGKKRIIDIDGTDWEAMGFLP